MKLKLVLNSTSVEGDYSIVDITFNGVKLGSSVQLSANNLTLEYDASILTDANNVVTISLLNDKAVDNNNDGDYLDAGDETMQALVQELAYSTDGTTYNTVIPQAEQTAYSSASEQDEIIRPAIAAGESVSFGELSLEFDLQGLENTAGVTAWYAKEVDGVYYDAQGNVVE